MPCRLWSAGLWCNADLQKRFGGPDHLHLFEDGGDTFHWNTGNHLQDNTESQPRRPQPAFSAPWEAQISFHIMNTKLCGLAQWRRRNGGKRTRIWKEWWKKIPRSKADKVIAFYAIFTVILFLLIWVLRDGSLYVEWKWLKGLRKNHQTSQSR